MTAMIVGAHSPTAVVEKTRDMRMSSAMLAQAMHDYHAAAGILGIVAWPIGDMK